MTLDMTRGRPAGLLLRFAFPLMLSSLLQQCYNLCDSLIVGRFLGAVALTATGSAGNLHWFPLNLVCTAIYAYGVALSQRFGARDREGFRRFFAGSLVLGSSLGLAVTVLGCALAERFLMLLGTPQELVADAAAYLRVVWGGFLVTAWMNLLSTALMSMGDSRTPLVSLAISSVANIVLDVVFLAWFGLGIPGAALATVLAQLLAAAWNFRELLRKGFALPGKVHFRLRWEEMKELLRLSIPQMLSSAVINSGDLLVQSVINSFGIVFVMGMNAARRYFNLLNVVGYGLEGAVATYVGQNWGAGDKGRIRSGVRFVAGLGLGTSVLTGLVVCLLARPMILFLLPGESEEVIRVGTQILRVLAAFLPSLYLLCEFRAAIQGMGNVVYPMLSGFTELAMRVSATLVLPRFFGREGLYFTDPAAWVPTMALMILGYCLVIKNRQTQPLSPDT